MLCPDCQVEMENTELGWFAAGAAPKAAYKCPTCQSIWVKMSLFSPRLVNLSLKGQDEPTSKYVERKLAEN